MPKGFEGVVMSGRYGDEKCRHKWRYRKDGWEEGCVPAVCIKCGAFGCQCDIKRKPKKEIFFGEGEKGNANINGLWKNPYVNKGGQQ